MFTEPHFSMDATNHTYLRDFWIDEPWVQFCMLACFMMLSASFRPPMILNALTLPLTNGFPTCGSR